MTRSVFLSAVAISSLCLPLAAHADEHEQRGEVEHHEDRDHGARARPGESGGYHGGRYGGREYREHDEHYPNPGAAAAGAILRGIFGGGPAYPPPFVPYQPAYPYPYQTPYGYPPQYSYPPFLYQQPTPPPQFVPGYGW